MSETRQTSAVRYAAGMFGTSIPINMFKTYAAAYYINQRGLTTEQMSLVLFLYTFLDAIDNPVYGFLSDRTRTRWGRRRPWLVVGAPLLALCFALFFHAPTSLAGGSLFIYMLLMYMLTGTLDSLINANYGALFPELFTSDASRAKTNALRQAFQLVAMVISIALTPLVTKWLGYGATALVYGLLAVVVIIYCALGCHEREHPAEEQKPKLLPTLREILSNAKFWIYGLANTFYSAAMSLVMVAVPFFVKYTLALDDSMATLIMGVVLLFAMGGVALWALLVRRRGLMPTWRAALAFLGVAFLALFFAQGLALSLGACVLVGLGFAGAITSMDLVGARIMDEDRHKYGVRREGIYSSVMGVMNKLSGLFVSLGFLLVSRLYGFQSAELPGGDPGGAARFLLALFPLCAMVLSIGCAALLRFPAEKADE